MQTVSESFEISIDAEGSVRLDCAGYISFLRAFESFVQLVSRTGEIARVPLQIKDTPSYAWRGVMLDLSRYF